MPSADSKVGELSKLKNKLLEIEGQLKEERKTTARLRDQSEKKLQQIALVDAEIAAEMEKFRWKKEEILFSMKTTQSETDAKLKTMKSEEKYILEEIADFDLIQYENEKLHSRLKVVASEQMDSFQAQTSERERKKQKDFDIRMAMEEMLRKTIKNVDESYEREAIAKMHLEASLANVENDRIHKEFDLREAQTEDLIRQQQYSYDELMKIKIEKDVVEISAKILEKNIQKLTNQNSINERSLISLQNQVNKRKDEVKALSLLLSNKTILEKEILEYELRCEEVNAEILKFRRLCLDLCNRLIRESFKIQGKQRINQNSELSKQLDDLSSQDQHHDNTYQKECEFRDISPRENEVPIPVTETSTQKKASERVMDISYSEPIIHVTTNTHQSDFDLSSIWKLPDKKKETVQQLVKRMKISKK